MIEEYARHNGHSEFLRESPDGGEAGSIGQCPLVGDEGRSRELEVVVLATAGAPESLRVIVNPSLSGDGPWPCITLASRLFIRRLRR
jgi:hypothetical protein